MAIDRRRLREYLRELQALQARVSDPVFFEVVQAQLIELIARGELDTEELEFILPAVDRIFKTEFAGFETQLLGSYNDTLDLVNELYDDLGEDVSREFATVRAIERTNQLQLDEYEKQTREAIARTVRDGAVEDKSVAELEEDLAELGGKAAQYAGTLAATHLKRYGRASRYHKSLVAGVDIYEYAGVLRDTTRSFCRACLGKLFHIDDILNMMNGNLEPVIENCGGWNCIHEWEPDPTATEADTVSGKLYTVPGGARLYGDEGIAKEFSYSIGLERLGAREGVQAYIDKTKKVDLTQDRIDHIKRKRYQDVSDQGIRVKVGQLRSNPKKVYYQYNKGPRIVYEKNGEFLFVSARRVHTLIKPSDINKFRNNFVKYFVELKDYE